MAQTNLHDVERPGRPCRLHANPPVPGRKNPEPDLPQPPGRDDDDTLPPDDDEVEHHRPGRDERVLVRAHAVGAARAWQMPVAAAVYPAWPARTAAAKPRC